MRWEILSVEQGAEPNDVLVKVAYWYDQLAKPRSKVVEPDFVEDHLVLNVPGPPPPLPVMDDRGFYVGTNDNLVYPQVEVDGAWVPIDPYSVEWQPLLRWNPPVEVDEADTVLDPIRRRAAELGNTPQKRPAKGHRDEFAAKDKPQPAKGRSVGLASKANVRGIQGRSEAVK